MLISRVLVLCLLFCSITSCDEDRVFDEYKSVNKAWHKTDKVNFKLTLPDTTTAYNLFVNVRNTNDYKYNNLFLIVQMAFPNGKTITDTLEYKMANAQGKLLGTGFSKIKDNKLWYKEQVVFNEVGDYQVSIQHAMRKNGEIKGIENLEGVTDVGFRVEIPRENNNNTSN